MDENKDKKVVLGSLYDFNKRLMMQMPAMTEEDVTIGLTNIGTWFSSHVQDKYFMLLCRERYDFTIFHFNQHNYNKAVKELKELLYERGVIISIDYNHDEDNYDIWVRNLDETFMFKIFPYDNGVIEVI